MAQGADAGEGGFVFLCGGVGVIVGRHIRADEQDRLKCCGYYACGYSIVVAWDGVDGGVQLGVPEDG